MPIFCVFVFPEDCRENGGNQYCGDGNECDSDTGFCVCMTDGYVGAQCDIGNTNSTRPCPSHIRVYVRLRLKYSAQLQRPSFKTIRLFF